jgi:hypothetical protein
LATETPGPVIVARGGGWPSSLPGKHDEGAAHGQNHRSEFFRDKQAALEPFKPGLFDNLIDG